MSVKLDVSIGEALDKLTILEIKCNKLSGSKHHECKKEYDSILSQVGEYLNLISCAYYYATLKNVNLRIWEMQDNVKELAASDPNYSNLWTDISLHNDMRFRIKNKINNALNSAFKEQKGYAPKTLEIRILTARASEILPAIRYLSICSDLLVLSFCDESTSHKFADLDNDRSISRVINNAGDSTLIFRDDTQIYGFIVPAYVRDEY